MGIRCLVTRQIDGKIFVFALGEIDDYNRAEHIANRCSKSQCVGESFDTAILTVDSAIQFFEKPPQEIITQAKWLDYSYFEASKWSCEYTEEIYTLAKLYYDCAENNLYIWKMIHV